MRQFWMASRAALVSIALATAGGSALAQGGSRVANVPHILIVDKHAIMDGSRLGEDIRRQVLAYEDSIQNEFGAQGEALQKEMQALQAEAPSLPPDARARKIQSFQAKEAAYRQKVQARQTLVQGGELVSRKRYLAEVAAVVHAIMLERGADLVVDKSSVEDSVGGLDITGLAIKRLDAKITSLKVPLVNPPPTDTIPIRPTGGSSPG